MKDPAPHFVADPDPAPHFVADPDPAPHFVAEPDLAPHQKMAATTGPQNIQKGVQGGPPWRHLEPPQLLYFDFDADPVPTFD